MTVTLKNLLLQGQETLNDSSESARLDAEILLCHALNQNRAYLYANSDIPIDEPLISDYRALINKRATSIPVAHLTGEWEFWSLPLRVTADVLVPRPETELLVETALAQIPQHKPCDVLDMGTGSGAIAIAIATERLECKLTAIDNSAAALLIATENAARHAPNRIRFLQGTWFAPVAAQSFDLIISNPPYVATGHPELTDAALIHEPAAALYSGADGLDDIRQLVVAAPKHLRDKGWLLLEHGFDQAEQVQEMMDNVGLTTISTATDFANQPRVTSGCMRR